MADGGWRVGPWLLGSSTILSLAILAGRLTGLVRELQLAASFGVSTDADIAVLCLTLPDLLVNLLLSGGLSAALVPRFRSMSIVEGDSLFRSAFVTAILTFSILALILLVWPGVVFKLLAPGLNDPASFINANSLVLIA